MSSRCCGWCPENNGATWSTPRSPNISTYPQSSRSTVSARLLLVAPAGIGFLEEAAGASEVARTFLVGLEVPLGTPDGEEVASVDVHGHREIASGVRDGMNDVVAEDENVTGRQLLAAGRLEPAGNAAVEGVVFLAAV